MSSQVPMAGKRRGANKLPNRHEAQRLQQEREEHRRQMQAQAPPIPVEQEGRAAIGVHVVQPESQDIGVGRILLTAALALLGAVLVFGDDFNNISSNKIIREARPNVPYEACLKNVPKTDNLLTSKPKVVFMVIDAWRLDFLTDSQSPMVFTRHQATLGRAILFRTMVQAPTVTQPRIEAMTSGTLSNFASIVSNFFSSESGQDTWLHQAKKKGLITKMYGDDTWLKLYPDLFTESEGVTSFFVEDYTEVDQNVTRNLAANIEKPFDLMVLHYLGLDHIGHSKGGKSPLINEKLVEMDNVIKTIFTKLQNNKDREFVLVVVGDHGMTEAGSHGSMTPLETMVPTVIFHSGANIKEGHTFQRKRGQEEDLLTIQQVDLAPTMSQFLGVPIPSNSRGVGILAAASRYWEVDTRTLFYDALDHALQTEKIIPASEPMHRMLFTLRANRPTKDKCSSIRDFAIQWEVKWSTELRRALTEKYMRITKDLSWNYYVGVLFSVASGFLGMTLIGIDKNYFKETVNEEVSVVFFSKLHSIIYRLSQAVIIWTTMFMVVFTSMIDQESDVWIYFCQLMILSRAFAVIRYAIKEKTFNYQILYPFLKMLVFIRCCTAFNSHSYRRYNDGVLPPLPYLVSSFESHPYLQFLAELNPRELVERIPSSLLSTIVGFLAFYRMYVLTIERLQHGEWNAFALRVGCCASVLLLDEIVRVSKNLFDYPEFADFANSSMVHFELLTLIGVLIMVFFHPQIGSVMYFVNLHVSKPTVTVVFVLCIELGCLAKQVGVRKYSLMVLLMASLFFSGFNNTISTIDISIAYKALGPLTYKFFAGLQILLNIYACPLILFSAYTLQSDPDHIVSEDDDQLHSRNSPEIANFSFLVLHRILVASTSLLAVLCFKHHIMIMSVFMPKLYLDHLHLLVSLVFLVIWVVISKCSKCTASGTGRRRH